jgi:hypothetical protein
MQLPPKLSPFLDPAGNELKTGPMRTTTSKAMTRAKVTKPTGKAAAATGTARIARPAKTAVSTGTYSLFPSPLEGFFVFYFYFILFYFNIIPPYEGFFFWFCSLYYDVYPSFRGVFFLSFGSYDDAYPSSRWLPLFSRGYFGFRLLRTYDDAYPSFRGVSFSFQPRYAPTTHTPLRGVFFSSANPTLLRRWIPLFSRGIFGFGYPHPPTTTHTPLFEGYVWFSATLTLLRRRIPLFLRGIFGFRVPSPSYDDAYPSF